VHVGLSQIPVGCRAGTTTRRDPVSPSSRRRAAGLSTQVDTPWTNGKIERFWVTLPAEVLDRQHLEDLSAADVAVIAYGGYYNYHRLHGEVSWQTPAERFNGTPFLDRGFDHVPPLTAVAPLLTELLAA
jgi:transposase InsO family protein